MIVTILAVVCIVLLGIITILGYRAIIRGGNSESGAEGMEKCTVCRQSISKELMVERQIGDYRILFFCTRCITGLSSDLDTIGDPGISIPPRGPTGPTKWPSDSSA